MLAIDNMQLDLSALVVEFMLVLARLGALLMATPIFRSTGLPRRIRLLLAVTLSVLVMIQLPSERTSAMLSLALSVNLASEIALGIAMGFMLQLVFAALSVAGESVAMGMGLGFANIVDPQNGTSVPTVSQHFVLLTSLLFIAMDGHLWALRLLFDSFAILPPGTHIFSSDNIGVLIEWAILMYRNALLVALPVLIAMLLTNLAFGIITRAAPQLNIFAIGFPLMLLIGMVVLMIHVEHLIGASQSLLSDAFVHIEHLINTF